MALSVPHGRLSTLSRMSIARVTSPLILLDGEGEREGRKEQKKKGSRIRDHGPFQIIPRRRLIPGPILAARDRQ